MEGRASVTFRKRGAEGEIQRIHRLYIWPVKLGTLAGSLEPRLVHTPRLVHDVQLSFDCRANSRVPPLFDSCDPPVTGAQCMTSSVKLALDSRIA